MTRKGILPNAVPKYLNLSCILFHGYRSFVVDPMHAVFEGVVKKMTMFSIGSKFVNYTFSIKSKLRLIDAAIKEVAGQVPHEFSRAPRSFAKHMAFLKGALLKVVIIMMCLIIV